jgi:crotonobetainyl-CoA:carnitine CoA-transferase CaiB-like acyl-CoA transferase
VVLALRHRDRTGEGQQIEMPLAEAFLPNIGEFILDYTMNGRVAPPQGNTHPHHAPHSAYATAGDDQWIAIDVGTDDEFAALCGVLDASTLAADARFATALARLDHRDELDRELAPLIAPRDKEALFRELQAAGVVAAPLHDELEVLADEQLAARDWFREIEMPTVGTHRYPGYLFKMRNTPDDVQLPPPLLGEHNEEVYLDILGYEREEYEALIEKGLVGTTYPPEILP